MFRALRLGLNPITATVVIGFGPQKHCAKRRAPSGRWAQSDRTMLYVCLDRTMGIKARDPLSAIRRNEKQDMQEPAVPEIHWFTTAYVIAEDRLRFGCALKTGDSDVFWLTRRLANALVKKLLDWLDKQTDQEGRSTAIAHRVAQQSATANLPRRPAGQIPDAPGWLAHNVGIRSMKKALVLTFQDDAGHALRVRFDTQHLRRWLKVLHVQYRRSGWSVDIWPDWIAETAEDQTPVRSGLLH